MHGIHPIRCVEAVFAGISLTQPYDEIERYTIRFKTIQRTTHQLYRHMVLAVFVPTARVGAVVRRRAIDQAAHRAATTGLWGAIGLSRESELMTKECCFCSLAALVEDFIDSYHSCGHDVVSLAVGLPISHDDFSCAPVCWVRYTFYPP